MISERVAVSFGEETKNSETCGALLANRVEDVLVNYGFVRYRGAITLDGKRRKRDYTGADGKVSVVFAEGFDVVTLVKDSRIVVKAPVFVEFHYFEEGLMKRICEDLARAEL